MWKPGGRVIGRILVNDIMVLSTNDMAVAVSNNVIVVVDVVTRLVMTVLARTRCLPKMSHMQLPARMFRRECIVSLNF